MIDREGAALTAALEDYRIRWTELISLTTEVNRWRSLYLGALAASVASKRSR
jgi:hypothetical protein